MNYNIKISLTGLVFLVLFSCDGFLDEKPQKSLLVPETAEEVRALLDGYNFLSLTPLSSFVLSDEWKTTAQDWQAYDPWLQNIYLWKRDVFDPQERSSDYQTLHGQLFVANTTLELLEKNPQINSSQEVNELKGEALVIRGRVLFDLALLFLPGPQSDLSGQISIPINFSSDINASLKMIGIGEIMTLIKQDLEMAFDLLPEKSEYKTRPDRLSAMGLLARVYLYEQNWEKALEASSYVLQGGGELLDYSKFNPSSSYPFPVFNQETVYFLQMQTSAIPLRPNTNVVSELYDLFAESDLRKKLFFRISPTTSQPIFKGSYTGNFRLFSGITLPEMYLIASEAAVRIGQLSEGWNRLNELRATRYSDFQPLQNLSQQETLEEVLKERKREMVYRNMRWMDMKRTKYLDPAFKANRVLEGITYTLRDEEQFIMKIPPYEVELGEN